MEIKSKKLIPCIFMDQGNAVKWFDNREVISNNIVELATEYCDNGADALIILDLSVTDEDHENAIEMLKKINRNIRVPMYVGGNVKNQEDAKKILYAGARKVILNLSKKEGINLVEPVSKRFGKNKVAVSLNDFDTLFKRNDLIEEFTSGILFMHRPDLNSVVEMTTLPTVILTDVVEDAEITRILKCPRVYGVSGKFVSKTDRNLFEFKEVCEADGIKMSTFESSMDFSEFKLNEDGLMPVVTQDFKTGEVLMVAYMDREAFEHTIKTGKMAYHSRSRNCLWIKGETSGHFQHLKSLTVDCDRDTLLAKVAQVGPACHTGEHTCFHTPIVGSDFDETNPLEVFQSVYDKIVDRKENPKEGSYTNYLFDKGIDKILKKIGEEATELVIAAKNPNPEEIKYELSDFLYHAMVLMVERGVTWEDIIRELSDRK